MDLTTRLPILFTIAALALTGCSDTVTHTGETTAPTLGPPVDSQHSVDTRSGADHEAAVDLASPGYPGQPYPGLPHPAPYPSQPGPLESNTFRDEGTSGFIDARLAPLSTFGLDVDTASYTVARTLIEQGLAVPPESIRPEEWINNFSYGDADPRDDDLAVRTQSGPGRSGDNLQVVRVAVAARTITERPPANITLVVDRSGSMDIRSRLGLVRESLTTLADELRADDTVSVVTFADEAEVILPPTRVADRWRLLSAVSELTPGGSTNAEHGLRLGYEQARSAFIPGGTNVVVLCSDGVANVGDTGPESILGTIAEEGRKGIHLVTVGFGMGNYNDYLMEQLANQGDGFYRYVDTTAEARRVFVDELTTILAPVAKDARAQVSFNPDLVHAYRLIGYENRAMEDDDFTDMTVDAGELGSGHRASALYEVKVAEEAAPRQALGTATVRWVSIADGSTRAASAPILAASADQQPPPELALAGMVADFALLLKGGDLSGQREVGLLDLAREAHDLELAGVPGAAEVSRLVSLAAGRDG